MDGDICQRQQACLSLVRFPPVEWGA